MIGQSRIEGIVCQGEDASHFIGEKEVCEHAQRELLWSVCICDGLYLEHLSTFGL